MEQPGHARNFRELVVYKLAYKVSIQIFEASQEFPEDEKTSLTSPIRRSSRAIGAQIAEAWANRVNERQFVNRLTDADGEQMETQHWIRVAFGCGYLDETEAREIIAQLDETGRLLNGMIAKAASFCATPPLREQSETSHS